ncbi:MAG TPA: recombination mediator RecR [Actinomycetota bacterium]|nr:recombination mediator RecR [Actinomycetota bacterium]
MFAGPIQDLIDELARLPGIGPKSAQRVAIHLLKSAPAEAHRLAQSIVEAKDKVVLCKLCFNFSDSELCIYCSDPRRDPTLICVVQEAPDIVAIERTREYRGLYHVLQGAVHPLEGVRIEDLRVSELVDRVEAGSRGDGGRPPVEEVIIATNPNVEGEATAMELVRLLAPLPVRVTRLASGLPIGGDLEFADEVTLGRALEGRRSLGA